ncbi:MAG: DUF11 domain-containing protein, partial [Oscillibacter sp.]|nr:DUF11 domain-containing protein [Oscillibacter sp.]
MKNMKKTLCVLLTLVMVLGMLPMSVFAGNTSANQTVYFKTVRVYNVNTYEQFTFDVGTAFPVKASSQSYNSASWAIPDLSAFLAKNDTYKNYTYTMAQSWNSSLYGVWSSAFTGQTGGQKYQQPGKVVELSTNNPQNKEITYYVTEFKPGSTGVTPPNPSTDEDLGGYGKYTAKFKIVYHSNYPDGTDYTVTVNCKAAVLNASSSTNVWNFKSYSACGFGGYTPKSNGSTWYSSPDCTSTKGTIYAANGGVYHLYAGWQTGSSETKQPVTLTYIDRGVQYDQTTMPAGSNVTILDCTNTYPDHTFKGWSLTNGGEVAYEPDEELTVNADTTLYAVWESEQTPPVTTAPELTIVKEADKSIVKVGETVEYTITVTNTGDAEATNVVISDTLPEGLEFVDSDNFTKSGRTYTWDKVGTVAAGASASVTFTAKVTKSGVISNTASVTGGGIPPVESDPEDITGVKVSIKTTKGHGTITVDEATGVATIPYTVTVTNTGDDLFGLDIIDALKVKVTDENGNASDANVSVSYADITVDGVAVGTEMTSEGGIVNAIARGDKFAANQTVTLTYNILVKNESSVSVMVNLSNTATGGSWSTNGAGARMFSLARSGGYDVTDSASSSASVGDNTTVVIPPVGPEKPDKVIITIEFVELYDGDEYPVGSETVEVDKGANYDVTDEASNIPAGYETHRIIETRGEVTGIADSDKTVTVVLFKDSQPPHTHVYTSEDTTPATCTKAGERTYTCACGDRYTDVIPALGHDFVDAAWEDNCETGDDADCDGHTMICNRCEGAEEDGTKTAEHVYGEWTVVTEATIDEEGEKSHECIDCGHIETVTIPTLDKVTITVVFVDEEGNEVGSGYRDIVALDDDYDVTEEASKIPEGYEPNGDPEGDELSGTADADKTIIVPVKKISEPVKTVTVTWVDEDGTVLDGPKSFTKGETEPAQTIENPTKAEDDDYTYAFSGWDRSEDEEGNVTYTATYTPTPKNGGETPTPPTPPTGGGGGGTVTPPTPDDE